MREITLSAEERIRIAMVLRTQQRNAQEALICAAIADAVDLDDEEKRVAGFTILPNGSRAWQRTIIMVADRPVAISDGALKYVIAALLSSQTFTAEDAAKFLRSVLTKVLDVIKDAKEFAAESSSISALFAAVNDMRPQAKASLQ